MWRALKPNHRNSQPSIIYVLDTETDASKSKQSGSPVVHTLAVGCAARITWRHGRIIDKDELVFCKSNEFWKWLYKGLRPRRPAWVYAHNFPYDWQILKGYAEVAAGRLTDHWQYPAYRDRETGVMRRPKPWKGWYCEDGKPWCLFLCHEGNRVNFVDTFNYWPTRLSSLGPNKESQSVDRNVRDDSYDAAVSKCRADVDCLQAAILGVMAEWHRENCGVWQPTAARLAITNYRHSHRTAPIVFHDDKDIQELERKSYYGGRIELFYQGDVGNAVGRCSGGLSQTEWAGRPWLSGKVYDLDVNSLYPSVMRCGQYPCRLVGRGRVREASVLREALDRFCVIADVTVKTTVSRYPVRLDNGLAYPEGLFRTVLAGPELALAWKWRDIVTVHEWVAYHGADLFTSYVDHWYANRLEARRTGDRAAELLAKMMLNSLYGKFGQMNPVWKSLPGVDPDVVFGVWYAPDCETGKMTSFRSNGGLVAKSQGVRPGQYYFPAISSYVTSYARVRMNDLMEIAGHGNVYHIATDALLVSDRGYDRLLRVGETDDTALGKLRLCGVYESGRFLGSNNFCLDGRWTVAGVGNSGRMTGINSWVVRRPDPQSVEFSRPPSGTVVWRDRQVNLGQKVTYRQPGPDGWTQPVLIL